MNSHHSIKDSKNEFASASQEGSQQIQASGSVAKSFEESGADSESDDESEPPESEIASLGLDNKLK